MMMVSLKTRSQRKLTLTGWGNSTQTNDAPIKNNGGGDGWGNSGGGEQDPDAGWNNGGQADDGNMGDAPQGKGMLDERMSEGTGLISNEFQVEVSLIYRSIMVLDADR
jgi:hypothetical protein